MHFEGEGVYTECVIVLAIDSGIERTGYAALRHKTPNPDILEAGCIFTNKTDSTITRMQKLGEKLEHIIDQYMPDTVVIEQLFFNTNKKTAIVVAQAQGITMYIAAQKKCKVEFLTPLEIKSTLTGYGRADKKQVEKMLKLILQRDTLPKPDDVTDALACGLAFCTRYNFMEKTTNI